MFTTLPLSTQIVQWPHSWSRARCSKQIPLFPLNSIFKPIQKCVSLFKQMSKHVQGEACQAVQQAGWKLLQVPAAEAAVNRACLSECERPDSSGPEPLLQQGEEVGPAVAVFQPGLCRRAVIILQKEHQDNLWGRKSWRYAQVWLF